MAQFADFAYSSLTQATTILVEFNPLAISNKRSDYERRSVRAYLRKVLNAPIL